MLFQNEVTFIGRHDASAEIGGSSGRDYPWRWTGKVPEWLSLSEAAARAQVSVEELKRAIREGELPAERRGWVVVHRGDLDEWRYRV